MAPRLFSKWFFPFVVLLLWCCMIAREASAVIPAVPQWGKGNTGVCSPLYPTMSAAFAAATVCSHQNCGGCGAYSSGPALNSGVSPNEIWRAGVFGYGGSPAVCVADAASVFSQQCGAGTLSCSSVPNSTKSGSNCVCNSGYEESGGQCVVIPTCEPATISGPGWYDMGTTPVNPPNAVCVGGCMAIFSGSSISGRALVDGIYHYYAPGQYDRINLTCSSGAGLPGTVSAIPADGCGAGQAMGEVNGKTVCVDQTGDPVDPVGTPGTSTTTTTETPTTPPTETNPADQSGDGTVVTVRPDGTSVTTTTTTNPTTGVRTVTQTETPPDPVSSFCEENPTSPICTDEGSSWGGTCAAFSCDGDAIQCAIAREQHRRNCTLFDTPTALSDLGNAGAAGTDSGTTGNPAAESNREVVPFASTLAQTRWLSAASCPAPVSITIMGSPVSFDFSDMCDLLQTIGSVGVAVALIAAVFIVGVF